MDEPFFRQEEPDPDSNYYSQSDDSPPYMDSSPASSDFEARPVFNIPSAKRSVLTFEVLPGKGVGPFLLGARIGEVFQYLFQHRRSFPRVEFKFCDKDPLCSDYIMNIADCKLQLRFDPVSQRLRLIEVYDLSITRLIYGNALFSGETCPSTFYSIYQLFGPTHPGDYSQDSRLYFLNYPGVTFTFPIPPQFANLYLNPHSTDLPVEFPDHTTPLATRMSIYSGSGLCDAKPPIPSTPSVYLVPTTVELGVGIHFPSGRNVLFGASPQDVIADLGPPSNMVYRSSNLNARVPSNDEDCFNTSDLDYLYNYFDLGLDIVFSGATHSVRKLVLHTNIPGNPSFGQYAKSNFKFRKSGKDMNITCDSKWNDIQGMLGTNAHPPAVNTHGAASTTFAPTLYYYYPGLILEVMKNHHISTVTMFSNEPVAISNPAHTPTNSTAPSNQSNSKRENVSDTESAGSYPSLSPSAPPPPAVYRNNANETGIATSTSSSSSSHSSHNPSEKSERHSRKHHQHNRGQS
eukprot:TRINITY_DN2547_c0_g2::TRINITY_DN2547_c0_g2_i1::g.19221::m.19221 TRINITY_DN2547_c0_g2::TRINITY_DN2547_c0_g2_i1::g.19221  ORF type:complete len:517 (+),score=53.71,sp/Q9SD33/U183_ARATH/37.34/1e-77,UPF0183/PF03676.9/2.3e-44,UPF0183/PF03676.9/4.3e-39 TRINITY_DN2547_c0_g2_i1:131-1681(+)